ncbi:MAG: hypothetical protein H5U38_08950 [Calditrichaeota bacterium]|nr:hypothetical protein [Calditrichota bacterium]
MSRRDIDQTAGLSGQIAERRASMVVGRKALSERLPPLSTAATRRQKVMRGTTDHTT